MARDVQITFDCGDPATLAEFWADALGYRLQDPPPGFRTWDEALAAMNVPPERRNDASALIDPEGAGPRLFFQRVPEGKQAKNRVHLDVRGPRASAATNGWRPWRPRPSGSYPAARPGCSATNPLPRWATGIS
jgi:hypothetical protein